METSALIQILQTAVTPAVLISGFGLLMLSMNNRLGRIIDRIRALNVAVENATGDKKGRIERQIVVLFERSQLLQKAIAFISAGVFFISVTVFLLFSISVFEGIDLEGFIQLSFAASLLCLIASLVFFMIDIRLTLKSLKIEISDKVKM